MKISIRCKGFSLSGAIAGRVQKNLDVLLAQGSLRIRRVDVTLSDTNGPDGGIDKCCRIKIGMNGLLPVVIEDVQPDILVAIDRAAGRALRAVLRRVALDNSRRRAEARRWLAEQRTRDKQEPFAA